MRIFVLFSIFIALSSHSFGASTELGRARELNASKRFQAASELLYEIVNNSRYRREQGEIAYELAKSYAGMGLRQPAVYNLRRAIKASKKSSLPKYLEVLSRIAFDLGDETGLNYALSKININSFPKAQKPILYFRLGQAYLRVGRFKKAVFAFSKISQGHSLYASAQYFLGLAYSEKGDLRKSYTAFTRAVNSRSEEGIVDPQRVAGLMGRARVLYHMKRWNESIEAYRLIPRDSKYFHDMLFESAWAMLRAGKFRSALSNFQSLHSEYYNNYFYPEATLLRGIIYLYICKVDEVNKIVRVYDKTYGKMRASLIRYLKASPNPSSDIKDFLYLNDSLRLGEKVKKVDYVMPYVLLRHLNRSSKVKAKSDYYYNLEEEDLRLQEMGDWSATRAGLSAKKIISKRKKGALKRLGITLREELLKYKAELDEFEDQKELLKFELISAEKEKARKKLEARDDFNDSVKEKTSRFTYTKNGYEYWPFQGEYWLDEIGNYHYLGVSRCE